MEKTSIVGRTTVALEPAGAAEVLWANAEGAPSAKPAAAVNEKHAKNARPSFRLPNFTRAPMKPQSSFAKYSSRSNRLHSVHLTNFKGVG